MAQRITKEEEQIAAVREFDRFYMSRFGLLGKADFDVGFTLGEVRILDEIGASRRPTARALRVTLSLSPAYVSQCLSRLTMRGLVRQTRAKQDRREKLLTLTPAGDIAAARINEQSALQIAGLLGNVSSADRDELLDSLAKVRRILSDADGPTVRIVRLATFDDDAGRLLQEYYEAVSVVRRDAPEAMQNIMDEPAAGLWLAYLDETAVGCVVLRRLRSVPYAAECKRLYVQPSARGHGIAHKLMDAVEEFARSRRLRWIYLDSYNDLKAALALYRKRGYESCERFNDNPQATVFLRKYIGRLP